MSPYKYHHHMRYNMYNINYKSVHQHSRAEPVYSHTFALQLMEAMQTGLYTEAELVAAEANGGADAVDKGRSQRRVEPMRSVRVDGGMCRSDVLMQMQADITNTLIGGCCSVALHVTYKFIIFSY